MVHALHRIHSALAPDGLLVDTQPVSPHPPVTDADQRIGTLDLRDWLKTINDVDRLTTQVIDHGLYTLETERRFTVTDTFQNGPNFVDSVRSWRGTQIPRALGERAAAAKAPVRVDQEVRLRVLRALLPRPL